MNTNTPTEKAEAQTAEGADNEHKRTASIYLEGLMDISRKLTMYTTMLNVLKHVEANPALPTDPFYLEQIRSVIRESEKLSPFPISSKDELRRQKQARDFYNESLSTP